MAEYAKAFENEIAIEMTIQDIGKGIKKAISFIMDLIKKAVNFLIGLIKKLAKVKKTDKNPTPVNMAKGGAEVMKKEAPKVVTVQDVYDCGNELNNIVADIDFCVNLVAKRPMPNNKVNKHYEERWAGDNELMKERLLKDEDVLQKLEGIQYKSLTQETAEALKTRLETLSASFKKYDNAYDMFVRKHRDVAVFMGETMKAFTTIVEISNWTLKMILQLYAPAENSND